MRPTGDAAAPDLAAARADVAERLERAGRELTDLVAAATDANLDDEHDPEGATVAWERQALVATVDRLRARLAELDAALVRAGEGSYGRCARCGGPIGAERLAARPSTPVCVDCARGSRPW